ncbi:hypothetical protein [Chitinophaga rhizophila]|uniref:Uncharacterized protein n=1 Tax=Chitinophaga rhizophila TaxID=2866212 RepID=A0ABS7G8L8_9BACT|nr:hypothetical protein [Chitinophaga rhizophila]MBW8683042.1 hypothetical protein [Chitinophaga rhizophila]
MEKAKFTLIAIALFAVAGGTFAFNATRLNSSIYYATTANQPATLTIRYATTAPGFGAYAGTAYATTSYSAIVTRSVPYYRGL